MPIADRGHGVRRGVAFALPVVLPPAMCGVFRATHRRFGEPGGYVAGFAVYWTACIALAVALVGRERLVARFRDPARAVRTGEASTSGWATIGRAVALGWPPAGAIATRFLPERAGATPTALLTSGAVAVTNAIAEEALWRGVYLELFPGDRLAGWLWPAVGFGAWHLAPQEIHPSPMGRVRYAAAAGLLGASWGWDAYRTGSIRLTTLSHMVTDGSGIRSERLFLPGR